MQSFKVEVPRFNVEMQSLKVEVPRFNVEVLRCSTLRF
jgi:hypothetical protein